MKNNIWLLFKEIFRCLLDCTVGYVFIGFNAVNIIVA